MSSSSFVEFPSTGLKGRRVRSGELRGEFEGMEIMESQGELGADKLQLELSGEL
jgi:hypothetical protein